MKSQFPVRRVTLSSHLHKHLSRFRIDLLHQTRLSIFPRPVLYLITLLLENRRITYYTKGQPDQVRLPLLYDALLARFLQGVLNGLHELFRGHRPADESHSAVVDLVFTDTGRQLVLNPGQ